MSDGTYTGADLFVDALERYGVRHVFGNPGTTELPVMRALGDSDLEYVLGLHEDVAVGMAAGYAQTRRYHADDDPAVNPVGVVNLHITPGLAHGTGNTFGADFTGAPLVITAGNHELDFRHEEPLLSGELEPLVDQFCKDATEVTSVDALPMLVRRAFRTALTPPTGPVFLGLPMDVMTAATDATTERLGPIPDAGTGDPTQVERAADALVAADRPKLVLGDGVARAGTDAVDAAVRLAEASGAGVHGEVLASEINFPTTHDQWLSFVPPTESVVRSVLDTDTVVLVGCSTNTTVVRHEAPLVSEETTLVHVSAATREVGKNVPADVAVLGDPGRVMGAMAARVADRIDEETRAGRLAAVADERGTLREKMLRTGDDPAAEGDDRASKAELADALRAVAPDAFIVDEGVTSKYALLPRFDFAPRQFVSNKGGGLGYGLPASVGAAVAESMREDPRDVVGFVGDGAYLYYPHALYSAARYDLDLTVVVSDNRNYRILKDNMTAVFGGTDDDYEYVGMDFDPHVDIPANAESHGATGHLVASRDGIEPALSAAIDADGPHVVDVLVHD
jgi:benzoylformate decarboxylase